MVLYDKPFSKYCFQLFVDEMARCRRHRSVNESDVSRDDHVFAVDGISVDKKKSNEGHGRTSRSVT